MATTMVHIRVEEKVKATAAKALSAMGMSVSDPVRVLPVRVAAEKALPFSVPAPPASRGRGSLGCHQALDQVMDTSHAVDTSGGPLHRLVFRRARHLA
jgi:addiction module RelB/DinJ family antitoxin